MIPVVRFVRWFESRQNWFNIATVAASAITFALGSVGMLGLSERSAFIVTVLLTVANGAVQLYLRNTSTDMVTSKAAIADIQSGATAPVATVTTNGGTPDPTFPHEP
jgi:hypothetical protein